MKLRALLCAAAIAALLAGPVRAQPLSTPAPELNAVASAIAGQALEVRCWINNATPPDVDADPFAWGYVYLATPVVYLDPRPCAGALALAEGSMAPLWELGLGALVLTHESYHQKLVLGDDRRGNEAQTECRAVKRVEQTMLDLGATPAVAGAVLPWAIAEHYKISTFQDYNYPSCRVPVFADFWP